MEEPTSEDEYEAPPIPEILYSAFAEAPFSSCVQCGSDLSDPDCVYQIQKAWKSGEVVFELALCIRCAAALMSEFSEESLEKMQSFLSERFRPGAGLAACSFCGAKAGPEAEYEIGAACRGSQLLRPAVLVCCACTASSQEDLSRKTRDAWGDFLETNLPGVPQSMEPVPLPF